MKKWKKTRNLNGSRYQELDDIELVLLQKMLKEITTQKRLKTLMLKLVDLMILWDAKSPTYKTRHIFVLSLVKKQPWNTHALLVYLKIMTLNSHPFKTEETRNQKKKQL